MITDGSSPLTRGKRSESQRSQTQRRLIPAHAGKTVSQAWGSAARSAHPRSRGENAPTPTAAVAPSGSSPLTRGKRACTRASSWCRRLIPAHAGKTLASSASWRLTAAHPRSRGENSEASGREYFQVGSSPLTRGKPRAPVGQALAPRLIPAHAGKTRRRLRSCRRLGAHPRSRGENALRVRPPRERQGLIPAHAGKTHTERV